MVSFVSNSVPLRVLIVGGSLVWRLMVEGVLSASPDFRIVGTAGPEELPSAVEDLRPSLVIVDVCATGRRPVLDALRDYRSVRTVMILSDLETAQTGADLREAGEVTWIDKRLAADDREGFRSRLRALFDPAAAQPQNDDSAAVDDPESPEVGAEVQPTPIRRTSPTDALRPGAAWSSDAGSFEATRREALAALDIANDRNDRRLDTIVRHLCMVTDYPMAAVTLIDGEVQWIKAAAGLERGQTPRADAICAQTIMSPSPLIIGDARKHPIFSMYPCVTGEPGVRAYVGVPLTIGGRLPIGAVCLLDTRPRAAVQREIPILFDMAELIAAMLDDTPPRLAA